MSDSPAPFCNVLSLDGGGAKGFYTLGILSEVEALLGGRLHEHFHLIFGTSTGAIIAALLATGRRVAEVQALYAEHVVKIMRPRSAARKTAALEEAAKAVFGGLTFRDVKTGVGIIATRWTTERPMIFKGSVAQAHGRVATFEPGFGCTIADAVVASCSAFPFFKRKTVTTTAGDHVELIDGGYCANNPTLYAIADATVALEHAHEDVRVLSLGVGSYPTPTKAVLSGDWFTQRLLSVQLLQKTLEINTTSMEQLRTVLFKHVPTERISDGFTQPEMATDFFEHDLSKLNVLQQRGRESFAAREQAIRNLFGL
ncbi:MAG: patatin-like phospholipase family protein [Hyphomonadaceae bacterium]